VVWVGVADDLYYLHLVFALRVYHLNVAAKYFALDIGRLFGLELLTLVDVKDWAAQLLLGVIV
jgi:hypothetical protein